MQRISLSNPQIDDIIQKSDTLEKVDFEGTITRSISGIFKAGDEFFIWGPASVEIVDKEDDLIRADALEMALPQLLKRARLSLEHSDQLVGRILESFETPEPVEVEIDGKIYKRDYFPTDVLDLHDDEPPALYVAGEVFNDSKQANRTREQVENGELNSYSISGEAIVTRKKVGDGYVYDDIVEIDLSAVTLCREGMNQGAKFAQVSSEVADKTLAGEAIDDTDAEKSVMETPTVSTTDTAEAVSKHMTEEETGGDEPSEKENRVNDTLDKILARLPEEGELATKEHVQSAAMEAVEKYLPDGDLATIDAMTELVKNEVSEAQLDEDALIERMGEEFGLDSLEEKSLEELIEEVSKRTWTSQMPNQGSEGTPTGATGGENYGHDRGSEEDTSGDHEPGQGAEGTPTGETGGERGYGVEREDADYEEEEEEEEKTAEKEFAKEPNVDNLAKFLSELLSVPHADAKSFVEDALNRADKSVEWLAGRHNIDLGETKDEVSAAREALDDEEEYDDKEELEPPIPEEEEEEEVVVEDDGDDSYKEALERLKSVLPEDVWKVVSEYVPEDETIQMADDVGDISTEDDVSKSAAEIVAGAMEAEGASIPVGDTPALAKQYQEGIEPMDDDDDDDVEKTDDGISAEDGPALAVHYSN